MRRATSSILAISSGRSTGRRSVMPRSIAPMLATLASELPADPERFTFEFKWDGIRAITFWNGKELRIHSRNQLDITRRYPELHDLGEALGVKRSAILDGEIVALDENDQPSFSQLQHRMHIEGAAIDEAVRSIPIHYVLFDLLYLDGRSVMDRPLAERRALLQELTLAGPFWHVSPALVGEGQAMLATAKQHRLEGVVAKRLDSVYLPGQRSPAWRKIKLISREEFVVGGWTPQEGTSETLGALHVGYYEPSKARRGTQSLRYAGAVGSGFNGDTLRRLGEWLHGHASSNNPFVDPLPRRDIRFVRPKLVVEVEYRRWPPGGRLQQAAFKGVRMDKRASEVVREDASCRP